MDVKKEREEPWGPVPNPLDYLPSEERELIESIVIFQDKYELPSDSDVKKLQVWRNECPCYWWYHTVINTLCYKT